MITILPFLAQTSFGWSAMARTLKSITAAILRGAIASASPSAMVQAAAQMAHLTSRSRLDWNRTNDSRTCSWRYALIASFFILSPITQIMVQWKFERLLVLSFLV